MASTNTLATSSDLPLSPHVTSGLEEGFAWNHWLALDRGHTWDIVTCKEHKHTSGKEKRQAACRT